MKRTLVALLAIVVAVAIVALFAWAQDPTRFTGNVEATGTITGTTITASTGFAGDLTGAVTGNVTGNITGNVSGKVTGIATKVERCGAVPDTATAVASGDGHILISAAGGTLFIWNATTTTYNSVAVALTQDAN